MLRLSQTPKIERVWARQRTMSDDEIDLAADAVLVFDACISALVDGDYGGAE